MIRLNLREGDIFRLRTLTEQQLKQNFEGQQLDIEQKTGYEYTYSVISVESGGDAWIEVVYTWVVFEQETIAGRVFYDSNGPPAEIPPGAEGFSVLVGNGFLMRLTPQGKVVEIEGLDAVYEEMLEALDIADDALPEQLETLFREQFGEEVLTQQLSGFTGYIPDGPVQVGDSWTLHTDISVLMPMIIETTYALRELDNGTAILDVASTISPDPEAEPLDFGLFKIGYAVSGAQEGVIRVDLASGLSSSTLSQTLSGQTILIGEDERITIPLSAQALIRTEFIKEE